MADGVEQGIGGMEGMSQRDREMMGVGEAQPDADSGAENAGKGYDKDMAARHFREDTKRMHDENLRDSLL